MRARDLSMTAHQIGYEIHHLRLPCIVIRTVAFLSQGLAKKAWHDMNVVHHLGSR